VSATVEGWIRDEGWKLAPEELDYHLEVWWDVDQDDERARLTALANELAGNQPNGDHAALNGHAEANGDDATSPADEQRTVERFHLTDLGNAERLVAQHGHDLRYAPSLGWLAWDGRRYRRDMDGEVVRRMKLTVRAIYQEAAGVENDKQRDKLVSHARRSEQETRLRAAISLAESEQRVVVDVEDLDADPFLLNVGNGVLDLEDGSLRPHERGHLITRITPVSYKPHADAPRWDAFLEQVFSADADLIAFVQRAVGYSLTGSTREQVLFMPHGGGANGKSTFLETIRSLFGEYAQQAPSDLFLEQRTGGPRSDIARLRGARFVSAVETGDGRRLAESLVKQLTGGDRIAARFLYRNEFEFDPTHKLWLATNHLPEVRGTDEAIWRRIKLIPFTRTIPEHERDPDLLAKLREELAGILAWAIEGCLAWQRDGLQAPAAVTSATSAYRADMDTIGRFLDEVCTLDPTGRTKAAVLYTRYRYWAEQAGERDPLTQKAFGLRLAERGLTAERDREARWWKGVTVRGESEEA
jgi:putative DNA primase/helicase